MGVRAQAHVRFAEFEVDLQSGELRKSGTAIRLPPQPFKVLSLLATNPGHVVTREEIQRHVWGDEVAVHFDQGLNHCIRQIRTALEDDAEHPRFVQTLPKRGYRFVGQLSEETPEEKALSPALKSTQVLKPDYRTYSRWMRLGFVLVATMLLAVLFIAKSYWPEAKSTSEKVTLLVLPLVPMSAGEDHKYFADGMTETLITELAQLTRLRVVSRTSAMQFKGMERPLPELVKNLGVDVVVEGSVVRSGDRVRITAQLINAQTDTHLWAQSYERDLRDVLSLQRELARAIAQEIKVQLTPSEQARLSAAPPVNPRAYEPYLKGRYYWNKRTVEDLKKGLEYFQEAIAKDPEYAPAYAGLADSYNLLGYWGALPATEAYPKATKAALRAIAIDVTLAEAHTSLADIKANYEWKWSEAEEQYRHAIKLSPRYAVARQWFASFLAARGKVVEAIAEAERARDLEPLSPILNNNLGWVYYLARRYDDSAEQFKGIIELEPDFVLARRNLARTLTQKGQFSDAEREFNRAQELAGDSASLQAELGYFYAVSGRKDEALRIAEGLKRTARGSYVSPYWIALVYSGLNDKTEAIGWLRTALRHRSGGLVFLNVDPRFDNLRSDPRFEALLKEMGLKPEGATAARLY